MRRLGPLDRPFLRARGPLLAVLRQPPALPPPAAVPGAFAAPDWTLSDPATGGSLSAQVLALPPSNGSAITAIERRVGAGSWSFLGPGEPGTYQIAGLIDGAGASVQIRAVNAVGAGPASDTKTATPTAPLTLRQQIEGQSETRGLVGRPVPTKVPGVDAPPDGAIYTASPSPRMRVTGNCPDGIVGWDFTGVALEITATGNCARVADNRHSGGGMVGIIVIQPGGICGPIEDCDIDGIGATNNPTALIVQQHSVAGDGAVTIGSVSAMRRLRFRNAPNDNVKACGANVPGAVIEDCWLDVGGYGAGSPHHDAITVACCPNGLTIQRNHFYMKAVPISGGAARAVTGVNNAVRVVGNEGQDAIVRDVRILTNSIERDIGSAHPLAIDRNDISPARFGGHEVIDNWITPNSGSSYIHPTRHGIAGWTGNRDWTTDALIPIVCADDYVEPDQILADDAPGVIGQIGAYASDGQTAVAPIFQVLSGVAGSAGGLFIVDAAGVISFDPAGDFDGLADGALSGPTTATVTATGPGGTSDAAIVSVVVTGIAAASLTVDAYPITGLSYPRADETGFAAIPISGTGVPGAELEVEDYTANPPAGWVDLATVAGDGTWSGSFAAIGQTAIRFRPRVRLKAAPTTIAQAPNAISVGPVILRLGQSIVHYEALPGTDNQTAPVSLAAENAVIFFERGQLSGETPSQPTYPTLADNWTSGVAAFANVFAEVAPTEGLTVIYATESGTGAIDLMDDALPERSWSDLEARVGPIYAAGSHISEIEARWVGENRGAIGGDLMSLLFYGRRADGAAVPYGTTLTIGPRTFDLDHSIMDPLAAPGERGQGLIDDRTKVIVLARNDRLKGGEPGQTVTLLNSETNGDGSTDSTLVDFRQYDDAVEALPAVLNSIVPVPLKVEGWSVTAKGDFDDDSTPTTATDTLHPSKRRAGGVPNQARQAALDILAATGRIDLPEPRVVDTEVEPDGSVARLIFDGPLTTRTLLEGGSNDVSGIEIEQGAGWRFEGFSAQLIQQTPVGIIAVTPAVAFASGSQIRGWNAGGSGVFNWPAHEIDERWKRVPIAPLPAGVTITGLPGRTVAKNQGPFQLTVGAPAEAAPELVALASVADGTGTQTVAFTAGALGVTSRPAIAGEWCVVIRGANASNLSSALQISGFEVVAQVNAAARIRIDARKMLGGETSIDVPRSGTALGDQSVVVLLIASLDATLLSAGTPATQTYAAGAGAATLPPITTESENAFVISAFVLDELNSTVAAFPAGSTLQTEITAGAPAGNSSTLGVAARTVAAAGAFAPGDFAFADAEARAALVVALRPGVAPPPGGSFAVTSGDGGSTTADAGWAQGAVIETTGAEGTIRVTGVST